MKTKKPTKTGKQKDQHRGAGARRCGISTLPETPYGPLIIDIKGALAAQRTGGARSRKGKQLHAITLAQPAGPRSRSRHSARCR
jgi:hypothetical protein